MKPVINDGTRARFGRLETQSREGMIQAMAREVLEQDGIHIPALQTD